MSNYSLWFYKKNLGIMFDNNLIMKDHVSLLCRTVNFHLRNLNRIRSYIDRSTCAHAVRSLILSRLDYGNSLLGGLSSTDRDQTRLAIPKTKTAFGDKSFTVFGPKLWNSLPANLREAPSVQCFKKLFKTSLFPEE